ncbi:NAD(P)H-hydrate dehydratase [Lachnospiraceae bacterium C1.1]|nr:NAD(P)H-hydrate dehydratase [Lachnospiraceae bacterium C1.1]
MEVILTKEEMQKADKRTSEFMHIPSAVLMERAALAVADCVMDMIKNENIRKPSILVVSGIGNNGGDGFAAGRILLERSVCPDFCLIGNPRKCSSAEKEEIESVKALKDDIEIYSSIPDKDYDIVIDAIFGISLNRMVEGIFAEAVEGINSLRSRGARVVSIDIPSGVNADNGRIMGTAVHADITLACAFKKPGLLLYPGALMAGRVIRAFIGITEKSLEKEPQIFAPDERDSSLPERSLDSNKATYGKVLIAAGSDQICGAALLATSAALRTGCGMVKVFTHENNRTAIQTVLPEALISTYEDFEESHEKLCEDMDWSDCILVGPGIGRSDMAFQMLRAILDRAENPLVMDADALNLIAEHKELLDKVPGKSIFTPHVGEMSRLCGLPVKDIKERALEISAEYAKEHDIICVLKDARTVTALPDGRIFINTSGNDGMSTAGSGDVLAGMTVSLMAQGMKPEEAAWKAVWLHGLAGDRAKEKKGAHGMIAGDIIKEMLLFTRFQRAPVTGFAI